MRTNAQFHSLALVDSNQRASTAASSLPKRKNVLWRCLKHPYLMPYNRLASVMMSANIFIYFYFQRSLMQSDILSLVLCNFSIALLIRQQQVVNLLFGLATSIPTHWPLWVRWSAGKVYHFGGIHVGGFFSGTVWFGLLVWTLLKRHELSALSWISILHFLILVAIILVSLPQIRSRYHDLFERIARFGNWISLSLFWIESLFYFKTSAGSAFYETKEFWILSCLTFSIALPWLRLRRVSVQWVRPSSHVAIAEFDYGVKPFSGSSTELSRSPFFEWHSFANVPSPQKPGYRLTISRAGDWTGKLIDELPDKIWVKGVPTAGVGNIEKLFSKVIWVATGSGIGPCLPHLLERKVPSRLVWSTRNPIRTYGAEFVKEILGVQPEAMIWDTDQNGKPDLVQLAYQAYREFGAEAVICISNKQVTWQVVQEFESRGIPAFGAIWDS